ncbi:MAG: hypothetical protein SFV54_27105 [Bryobacteraceae bacterium]|nr:hypothetical protein [Bryobacteraceae bacterium]
MLPRITQLLGQHEPNIKRLDTKVEPLQPDVLYTAKELLIPWAPGATLVTSCDHKGMQSFLFFFGAIQHPYRAGDGPSQIVFALILIRLVPAASYSKVTHDQLIPVHPQRRNLDPVGDLVHRFCEATFKPNGTSPGASRSDFLGGRPGRERERSVLKPVADPLAALFDSKKAPKSPNKLTGIYL